MAIQPNELRIGNLVSTPDGIKKITGIISGKQIGVVYFNKSDNEHCGTHLINSITLTPEILERCGFKKELMENGYYCYILKKAEINLRVFTSADGIFSFLSVRESEEKAIFIKSLHQLQNIFPLLWFEELEIKSPE